VSWLTLDFEIDDEVELIISDEALTQIAEVGRRVLQEQSEAGISASGEPFPETATKPHATLYDTGHFFGTAQASAEPAEEVGVLEFIVPYAELLLKRGFDYQGIAPQFWDRFEQEITPILEAGISIRE
jgi:hypothetical protein